MYIYIFFLNSEALQSSTFIRKNPKRQTSRFTGQLVLGDRLKVPCKIFTKVKKGLIVDQRRRVERGLDISRVNERGHWQGGVMCILVNEGSPIVPVGEKMLPLWWVPISERCNLSECSQIQCFQEYFISSHSGQRHSLKCSWQ